MFYKFIKVLKLFYLLSTFLYTKSYVTNANFVIKNEQKFYNEILESKNLPCHLQSSRIKSFESAVEKMKKLNFENIYNLNDLIGFRYVFYTYEDLLIFYHYIKLEKTVWNTMNYINDPKENGYSALHIKYKNEYVLCPINQLECQLYIIDDYYNSLYGKAKYIKNYTKFH